MEYIGINGETIIRLIFKFYCLFICGVDFCGSGLGVIAGKFE